MIFPYKIWRFYGHRRAFLAKQYIIMYCFAKIARNIVSTTTTSRRYISVKNQRGRISWKIPKFERFSHEEFKVSRILNKINKQKSCSTLNFVKIRQDSVARETIWATARETLREQAWELFGTTRCLPHLTHASDFIVS